MYLDLSNDIEQMDREDSMILANQLKSRRESGIDIEEEDFHVQNTFSEVPSCEVNENESDSSDEEIETPLANHARALDEVDQSAQFSQHNMAPLQREFNSLCSGYYTFRLQP